MKFKDQSLIVKITDYKGYRIKIENYNGSWSIEITKDNNVVRSNHGINTFRKALKQAIVFIDGIASKLRIHWVKGDDRFTYKTANFRGMQILAFQRPDKIFGYSVVRLGCDYSIKPRIQFKTFRQLNKHVLDNFGYKDTRIVTS